MVLTKLVEGARQPFDVVDAESGDLVRLDHGCPFAGEGCRTI
jgi:hypothetical protein